MVVGPVLYPKGVKPTSRSAKVVSLGVEAAHPGLHQSLRTVGLRRVASEAPPPPVLVPGWCGEHAGRALCVQLLSPAQVLRLGKAQASKLGQSSLLVADAAALGTALWFLEQAEASAGMGSGDTPEDWPPELEPQRTCALMTWPLSHFGCEQRTSTFSKIKRLLPSKSVHHKG